jgi:hypothetical protein
LRHVKADGARGVAVVGAANAVSDTAAHTAQGGGETVVRSDGRASSHRLPVAGGTGSGGGGGGKPVAVSRLQRVLAAQQPVPALTRDGQRLDSK